MNSSLSPLWIKIHFVQLPLFKNFLTKSNHYLSEIFNFLRLAGGSCVLDLLCPEAVLFKSLAVTFLVDFSFSTLEDFSVDVLSLFLWEVSLRTSISSELSSDESITTSFLLLSFSFFEDVFVSAFDDFLAS